MLTHVPPALFIAGLLLAAACGSGEKQLPASGYESSAARPADTGSTSNLPADSRPVIVTLGNSLTAGYGLPESQSYPARLQARLDAAGYRYRVINAGVSGDTSAQGLNRIAVALEQSPAIVIVELGPNDGLRGLNLESTRRNLGEIIRACRAADAKVVLAGMTLPSNMGRAYIRSFERIYTDLAEEYDLPLIPFFLEGVAARAELNLSDGIHPNAAGYEIVTENVWRALQPLLER